MCAKGGRILTGGGDDDDDDDLTGEEGGGGGGVVGAIGILFFLSVGTYLFFL